MQAKICAAELSVRSNFKNHRTPVLYIDYPLVITYVHFMMKHPQEDYFIEPENFFKKGLQISVEHNLAKIEGIRGKIFVKDLISLVPSLSQKEIAEKMKNIYSSVLGAQRHVALGTTDLYQSTSFPSKKLVVTDISSDGYSYSGRHFESLY